MATVLNYVLYVVLCLWEKARENNGRCFWLNSWKIFLLNQDKRGKRDNARRRLTISQGVGLVSKAQIRIVWRDGTVGGWKASLRCGMYRDGKSSKSKFNYLKKHWLRKLKSETKCWIGLAYWVLRFISAYLFLLVPGNIPI